MGASLKASSSSYYTAAVSSLVALWLILIVIAPTGFATFHLNVLLPPTSHLKIKWWCLDSGLFRAVCVCSFFQLLTIFVLRLLLLAQ